MVHLCGSRQSTFLNNQLLRQQGCDITKVKLEMKQVNCRFKGGHYNKTTIYSSRMMSLMTYNEIFHSNCILNKKVKTSKKSKIHATTHKGYASNLEDKWSLMTSAMLQLKSIYQFSRPHTIIGTTIGITSISLLPLQNVGDIGPSFFVGLMKINKPNLPLASGDLSMTTCISIVITSLIAGLVMGVRFQSPPLLYALIVSCVLGSLYSIKLPLLRWKRHAALAASCIIIVRAIIVQIAFFLHMQKYVLGRPVVITRSLVFATTFMCFFSTVIALFKDIPDLDGDKDFGIQTLSVNLGPKKVFWLCVNMLFIAYGTAIVVGAASSVIISKLVMVLGHCALASILWLRAQKVDVNNKLSTTSFYMFIWKLFYVEYFFIPFVR